MSARVNFRQRRDKTPIHLKPSLLAQITPQISNRAAQTPIQTMYTGNQKCPNFSGSFINDWFEPKEMMYTDTTIGSYNTKNQRNERAAELSMRKE